MRAIFILLLPALAITPLRAQDRPETFDLVGRVLEETTGRPLFGALVAIEALQLEAITDSAGVFVLPGVPAGEQVVLASHIGYAMAAAEADAQVPDALVLFLLPEPILMQRIEVLGSRLEGRQRSLGFSSWGYGREDLLASSATTVAEFLRDRRGTYLTRCPSWMLEWTCAMVRGRVRPLQIWLDEVPQAGDASLLEMYPVADVYRVEAYPSLGMVRLYTLSFVERVARKGGALAPICLVCGRN